LNQHHRKRQFAQRRQVGPPARRGAGVRPAGTPRHIVANARSNYERYSNLAREAARRGESIEAENLYQHAEHYFRVMREQG